MPSICHECSAALCALHWQIEKSWMCPVNHRLGDCHLQKTARGGSMKAVAMPSYMTSYDSISALYVTSDCTSAPLTLLCCGVRSPTWTGEDMWS